MSQMKFELIKIRAKIYNLFAEIFYFWPGEKKIDYCIIKKLFDLDRREKNLVIPTFQKLEQEYQRLFVGPDSILVPIWESAYQKNDKTLFNQYTLKLRKRYNKFNLVIKDIHKRPDDHLGLELAYIAELNKAILNQRNNKNKLLKEQQQFLEEHLLNFFASFKAEVVNQTKLKFYQQLVELLETYLSKDYMLLKDFATQDNFAKRLTKLQVEKFNYQSFFKQEKNYQFKTETLFTTGTNNCGGRCLFEVKTEAGIITDLSSKTSCLRGNFYRQNYLNYNRLKYPMKRVGKRGSGKFKRITWEQAVNEIASEIKRVGEEYGPQARYVNYAWGVNALIQPMKLAKRLLALDGGFLDFYNSYSTACTSYATPYTYGTAETGNSLEDWANSELIILWGHNPVETVFGTTIKHLREAKAAGAKVIVVDPRFSDTAASFADQWLPILPGSDVALMSAMGYVIITEDLVEQDFIEEYTLGFSKASLPGRYQKDYQSYKEYILGKKDGVAKTPQWAEQKTRLPAEKIVELAREYGRAEAAALVQGWGPQRHEQGEQVVRAGTVLATITANVGNSGGWASGAGYVKRQEIPSLPIPKNPYPGKIPSFLWTEAVANGKEMTKDDGLKGIDQLSSDIKLIMNLAGNCLINQHADCNRTAELLKDESKVEFIVVSDIFLTSSAKFADILLPGDTFFERDNLATPWSYGDYLIYANQAINPPYECRNEYDWLSEVADKLGIKEEFTQGYKNTGEWCQYLVEQLQDNYPEFPELQEFKEQGIYYWDYKQPKIAFKEEIENLEENPFSTPSGKIEIFSQQIAKLNNDAVPPIPKYIPAQEGAEAKLKDDYPLQCIGWHNKRRCHSIYDNNLWAEEVEPHRIWINPQDAKQRNINNGDEVEVFNQRGRLKIKAKLTERIMPGVVAIPQGGWWEADQDGVDRRGNINVLTAQRPTPLAKGNSQHTILVEVKNNDN